MKVSLIYKLLKLIIAVSVVLYLSTLVFKEETFSALVTDPSQGISAEKPHFPITRPAESSNDLSKVTNDLRAEVKNVNQEAGYKKLWEAAVDTPYVDEAPQAIIEKYFNSFPPEAKVHRTVNLRVPFGNESQFDCNESHCDVNGRQINKHLIRETPHDTFTGLPRTFLPEFRNPCWRGQYDGRNKLLCLPYFYIIGFTKCGTTDLFSLLKEHKFISSRAGKESHYFDRARRGRSVYMNRPVTRMPQALMSYANAGRFRTNLALTYTDNSKNLSNPLLFQGITMDATPSHVWDNEYWEFFHPGYSEPPVTNADLIHTLTPKAKIIISLRDPIKRMQSAYQFFCAFRVYKCDYPVTNIKFHNLVTQAVENMLDCFRKRSIRSCVYSTNNHQLATHLYGSIYSVYLKDWLKVFPRDQVYVMRLEDHIDNEVGSVNEIIDFLDLPPLPPQELANFLETHKVRNSLNDKKRIPYILPETVELLKSFFKPFNRELVELLGDNRFSWGYDD